MQTKSVGTHSHLIYKINSIIHIVSFSLKTFVLFCVASFTTYVYDPIWCNYPLGTNVNVFSHHIMFPLNGVHYCIGYCKIYIYIKKVKGTIWKVTQDLEFKISVVKVSHRLFWCHLSYMFNFSPIPVHILSYTLVKVSHCLF